MTVYAAASLTHALEDLANEQRARAGVEIRVSYASSSTLAKQIGNGAPADVYISASVQWMDYLEHRGLLEAGTRHDLVSNALVVVAPAGEGFRVVPQRGFDFARAFEDRLALGDPSHVPAGIYARQALIWLGWWAPLSGRLAPAMDVRGALAYVERGACAAGVVYATDATISSKVEVLAALPAASHDPIVYPVAVVKGRLREEVRRLMVFLASDEAGGFFRRYGFVVLRATEADGAPSAGGG